MYFIQNSPVNSIFLKILIITLVILRECESARILAVFPVPSFSHQVVFRPITQELARRGHEVIVITTDPAFPKGKSPTNLTEIDVHDFSYKLWKDFLDLERGNADDLYKQLEVAYRLLTVIFEKQIQTEEVQKFLKNKEEKFDLILVELVARSALVLSHIFKAPVIQLSSFGAFIDTYGLIGAPTHPLLYPSMLRQKLNNLTLFDKANELYNHMRFMQVMNNEDRFANKMLKRTFGENTPDFSELVKNVQMVLLNAHPMWESNIPVPPNLIYIGGLHQIPAQELPKDMKSLLDSAKNGVIYMSFGTNTDPSMLTDEKKQIFFKVLSESSHKVLWKWNTDDVPGHAKNIRYSKWFPQSDLLRHPNVKLFITQGGLQSTDETITAGVPVIGIPMHGDQWYNVERYVQFGIGVRLDLDTLTEKSFKEAIERVINDDRYRKNISKLRSIMHDQPIPPLDKAIFWIEHVIRHSGAEHLRSPAAHLSWSEYFELDLLFILLGSVLTILVIFVVIGYQFIKFVLRILIGRKVKKE